MIRQRKHPAHALATEADVLGTRHRGRLVRQRPTRILRPRGARERFWGNVSPGALLIRMLEYAHRRHGIA